MDSAELLAQLADIRLPEPVGIWPPAPGWWILAALLVAGIYFGGHKLFVWWRRRRFCQHALLELDRIFDELALAGPEDSDTARLRYANSFNSVLRRVALVHFPNSAVASLGGRGLGRVYSRQRQLHESGQRSGRGIESWPIPAYHFS